jgi:ribosomal-protein-alanine N-acetyltransferase
MGPGDLDAVLAIENASFATPWRREHFLNEMRGHRYAHSVVLRYDDGLLGYACTWRVDKELRINNIAIHPERRGRGLAGWLLRRVLRDAARAGCREATLEVRPSNTAALGLYRAHGFREVGRRPGYYQDTAEDAVLMARELEPE